MTTVTHLQKLQVPEIAIFISYQEAARLLSQLCGMWYVQTDTVTSNWHYECVSEFLNKIDNTS